jgi:hypothetical protein
MIVALQCIRGQGLKGVRQFALRFVQKPQLLLRNLAFLLEPGLRLGQSRLKFRCAILQAAALRFSFPQSRF